MSDPNSEKIRENADKAREVQKNRPEYVCCIAFPESPESNTLCGLYLNGWKFQSIDHAFSVAENGGRQQICPDCADVAISMIQSGTHTNA